MYTMNNLINLHPPYNIAGYQLPKHFCTECPACSYNMLDLIQNIIITYSKFLLDDEMVGDTINVFIETVFNTRTRNPISWT
jgi:hypothetical protein